MNGKSWREADWLDHLLELFASAPTMLASQLNELRKSSPNGRPIQRLMLAVLADALACFLGGRRGSSVQSARPSARRSQ